MIDRRPARILAMQALCQLEVLADHFLPQLDEFLAEEPHKAGIRDYAHDLVHDTWANLAELDRRIQEVAENWELKRMAAVDRNVLRVAACELFHRPDVPPAVIINEAVEIGQAFGTGESGAFINGVLDAVAKKREGEALPQPEASGTTDGTL
ncbi:MAG TPA: transcription antitermination factor NusB [Phycisphaerae bacterium]|nr:transcription antitermination factor NusB [Phycisphaerae bacterium]